MPMFESIQPNLGNRIYDSSFYRVREINSVMTNAITVLANINAK